MLETKGEGRGKQNKIASIDRILPNTSQTGEEDNEDRKTWTRQKDGSAFVIETIKSSQLPPRIRKE